MTFNRRRNGILKKAYELSILCDTQVVVLMFDHKQMCHVYSSEEGPNAHAKMMDKYLTKDFCTVDPIRNYDTSPDLQLENPTQAVWRVAREKVAVVNTYNVFPVTGTLAVGSNRQPEDDDDDEADGSEQLTVRSSRTYHTKSSESKGSQIMNTPALTDDAHSPIHRSESPEPQQNRLSPRKTSARTQEHEQIVQMQQGLGISGGGFTPLLGPPEQYAPILYPPQPPVQPSYLWQSPDLTLPGTYMNSMQGPLRPQYLPNMGFQYASSQFSPRFQYPIYSPLQYMPENVPPTPLIRQSPKKDRAHFNHWTYPPQTAMNEQRSDAENATSPGEQSDLEGPDGAPLSPEYVYANVNEPLRPLSTNKENGRSRPASPSRTIPRINVGSTRAECSTQSPTKKDTKAPKQQTFTYIIESPAPESKLAAPERRITRSQSRSPGLKARELPVRLDQDKPFDPPQKSTMPVHRRGPSLLDEITFDPETGAPMMEAGALASWLGTTPLNHVSPGHSRETSHVRGESVSQWLNLPQIQE